MSSPGPTLGKIKRHNGVAGQFALDVPVTYPGEDTSVVSFVGSTYGGPIVMVTPDGHQVFVSARVTDRIGSELTPTWVQRFFGDAS